jgi:DnaK suppressor protein
LIRPTIDPANRDVLSAERQSTLARIDALTSDLEAIIAGSIDANSDDEHDPEGSTIAYDRAQTAALLNEAHAYLADLDVAATRLAGGTYAICDRCGGTIASERLLARPATRTCIDCATAPVKD